MRLLSTDANKISPTIQNLVESAKMTTLLSCASRLPVLLCGLYHVGVGATMVVESGGADDGWFPSSSKFPNARSHSRSLRSQIPPPQLTVMSRNLYLGADFLVLFDPSNINRSIHEVSNIFFGLVESTDYPNRAKVIAGEIMVSLPDIVCLQEVFTYSFQTVAPSNSSESGFVDLVFLDILMTELGGEYMLESSVNTSNLVLPYKIDGQEDSVLLEIQDSDAILRRTTGGWTEGVVRAGGETFSTELVLPIVSNRTEGGPILTIKRGFCWVNAFLFDGHSVVIANTHFDTSSNTALQFTQATELVASLDDLTSDDSLPAILVGDFNAQPPQPSVASCSSNDNVYSILSCGRADPFTEANEDTYGTDAALLNLLPADKLKRIDHIFVPPEASTGLVNVFGKASLEELDGRFPSDHFGLICHVTLRKNSSSGSLHTSRSLFVLTTSLFAAILLYL